jgi:hypothetical protein
MKEVIFEYKNKKYLLKSNGELFGETIGYKWKNPKWIKINGSVNYKTGYVSVQLGHYSKGKKKIEYLHRLVAFYFIPNLENKPCVNHKDGNKRNNDASNLEWVTYSENHKHAYEKLNRKTLDGANYGGGIHFRKDRNYWIAYSDFYSKRTYLGSFKTEEEARQALNCHNELIGKNGVEDLKKARVYLDKLISEVEKK